MACTISRGGLSGERCEIAQVTALSHLGAPSEPMGVAIGV